MRFMMMMIPRVYQPDTPPGEKAGEGFAPPAEAVARMMKFNEE
ncbi:MAG TPA: YciI family protein, partial [Candidatus Bathyarchaeia archaeon]|nr:YciI family protein [Candidatus Bathyarchaeia archaeon]